MGGIKVSYTAGLLNLHQHVHMLTLKMAGTHFLLISAAHLSFHTSFSQVTTGKANVCASEQMAWDSRKATNRISLANSAVNSLEWLQVQCHLCPSVAALC